MNKLIHSKNRSWYQLHIVSPLGCITQHTHLRRIISYILMIVVLFSCGSDGTDNLALPSDVGVAGDGNLDATLEFIREQSDLPALGAMLIHGNEIVEMRVVGLRAIGFPESATIQDSWHLGSLTKAMTATIAARLVDQGVISWNTTVANVYPNLVGNIRSEYENVRMDELLSHTAGLPNDLTKAPSFPTLGNDTTPLPVQRRRLAAEYLVLEPAVQRGTFRYSNLGYVIAGSMLEEITGKAWEELIATEVFTPLGMESSGFGAPGSAGSRDEPWGHQRQNGGWRAIEPSPDADNPPFVGPAGTVHSTLEDYARFMIAHLKGARGEGELVSARSFIKLHSPAPGTEYALGWIVAQRDWAGGRVLTHTGSNTLWIANVWLAPSRNFAMLAVTNAGGDEAFLGTDTVIEALILRFNAAFGEAN
jgi:CubicO group peptidase (beta-lactamase class C family)